MYNVAWHARTIMPVLLRNVAKNQRTCNRELERIRCNNPCAVSQLHQRVTAGMPNYEKRRRRKTRTTWKTDRCGVPQSLVRRHCSVRTVWTDWPATIRLAADVAFSTATTTGTIVVLLISDQRGRREDTQSHAAACVLLRNSLVSLIGSSYKHTVNN